MPPDSAEAYPTAGEDGDAIVEFMARRFDPTVLPTPHVRDCRHLQLDGHYAANGTRFWINMRARASELLARVADPASDYVLTEVVHCKSRDEIGVASAADTCACRFLDRVLTLSDAGVVAIVGTKAHDQLRDLLDLPAPPYVVSRELAGRQRWVTFLWHPAGFKGPKKFGGLYSTAQLRTLREACA